MNEGAPLSRLETRIGRLSIFLLNLLATVHVVWFYLTRVECHIKLAAYEQGSERTPFQYRALLMAPMRWAHHSHAMQAWAARLTIERGFFPNGVRPEGVAQAVIDLVSIGVAGVAARKLYQLSSRTGLLTPYIYPLTLVMVVCTYSLLTMHAYRFIYDLPGLAFFSTGLYLLYTRARPIWFAAVFVIGTTNRETTIMLLVFFVLAQCCRENGFAWRQSYAFATVRVAVPLAMFWMGWRIWVAHVFAGNASVAQSRVWLNLGILVTPMTWPQVFGTFAYLLPLVLLGRRHIKDSVLRVWLWALPVWLVFMVYYGVLVETRIFGELIAYVACVSALIAEERLVGFFRRQNTLSADLADRADLEDRDDRAERCDGSEATCRSHAKLSRFSRLS